MLFLEIHTASLSNCSFLGSVLLTVFIITEARLFSLMFLCITQNENLAFVEFTHKNIAKSRTSYKRYGLNLFQQVIKLCHCFFVWFGKMFKREFNSELIIFNLTDFSE